MLQASHLLAGSNSALRYLRFLLKHRHPLFRAFAFAMALWVLRRIFNKRTVHLYYARSKFSRWILQRTPRLQRYRPTPWMASGHVHTIFPSFVRLNPGVTYKRELVEAPDGGTIALDWAKAPDHDGTPRNNIPTLILLHGLTGGSHERYVQWMVKEGLDRGLQVLVMNARGCSKSPLTTPQMFSAAWTEDIRHIALLVQEVIGVGTPLYAAGFSLGAGILSKYLCEEGDKTPLHGAALLGASFDLHISTRWFEQGVNKLLYNSKLTESLQRFAYTHQQYLDGRVEGLDFERVRKATTIREFDSAVVVPMFKYKDVWEYYSDGTTSHRAHNIRIPTLVVNAEDDPICSADGVPKQVVHTNTNIIIAITEEGGHLGWSTGWIPLGKSWVEPAVIEFFTALNDWSPLQQKEGSQATVASGEGQ